MDKREKRSRFLWVDWMILVVIVALVGLALWGWSVRKEHAAQERKITYTLCLYDMENAYFQKEIETLLPIGCSVMNANGTAIMGEVVAVWKRPTVEAIVKNKSLSFLERSDRSDLFVRVQANASEQTGDGFRVQDIRISAGKNGDFRIGGFFAPGALITSVEWEDT